MDIFSFFSGLRLTTEPARSAEGASIATHEAPSIVGYVEAMSRPPGGITRLMGRNPTARDYGFGIVVNFAMHVMGHDRRALLFGGSSHAIDRALDRNEEKSAVVAMEIKPLKRWLRTLVGPRGRLKAWFDNHQIVLWGVQKSFDLQGGAIGLVAIGDVDEPSIWAFHLTQNRSRLAPGALLVAAGDINRIDAFAHHVETSLPSTRLAVRRFGEGSSSWAICLGQIEVEVL